MSNNPKIMKIASIGIGIVIGILLIIMGFKVMSGVFTRAADFEPRDVVVSNIAENSTKLSWATGVETQGVVEYGTSPTSLNFFAPEPQKIKTHAVDLTLLSPNTTYYFQIRIGDKKYDNGGVPWTFTTKGAAKSVVSTPTSAPAVPTAKPTPVQSLSVPDSGAVTIPSVCNETDCAKIKQKFGKGCDTADYWKCIKKLTPTP
jgi:hypothetical protein